MKGIVKRELNRRTGFPRLDSSSPGYFRVGQEVFIDQTVVGQAFEQNTKWYRLTNGEYVWSGAIEEIQPEAGDFIRTEHQKQYILCFRQVKNGFPNIPVQEPADTLRFASLHLPQDPDTVQVFEVEPADIAKTIIDDIKELDDPSRRDVILYIHGYDFLLGLKIDLLTEVAINYTTHPQSTVAKVLFFSWPSNGQRSVADDNALKSGRKFMEKDLFNKFFVELSKLLHEAGVTLNLFVHSFAHQLLNGILNSKNPGNLPTAAPTFDKVILFAPDVTHLAAQKPVGQDMVNHFSRSDSPLRYDYSKLTSIASAVHVFYDHYDYLLYSSSKKFNGSNLCLSLPDPPVTPSKDYRNLGNFGPEILGPQIQPGLTFYHVQKLLVGNYGDPKYYPFRNVRDTKFKEIIERSRETNCHRGFNDIRTARNSKLFVNHHRYLFTCKQVVDKVLEILKPTDFDPDENLG